MRERERTMSASQSVIRLRYSWKMNMTEAIVNSTINLQLTLNIVRDRETKNR